MQRTRDRAPARRKRSNGQALVEFAIVLPIFMLVLAGILDFGSLLYSRITLISAARDGARVAIRLEDKSTIDTIARSTVAASAIGLAGASISTTVLCIPAKTATCVFANSGANAVASGDSVRVLVSYPYHSFFPLLFGNVITISASVEMVVE